MALPTSSIINENILYPTEKAQLPDLSEFQEKHFVEYFFDRVRSDLSEKGDRAWLTNGSVLATGSSHVLGGQSIKISEVEPRSRQIGRALYHKYQVGRGDVVHILLPNTTQYHLPVLGTWLVQGVVSPADPGLSPKVLADQCLDAGTKVIFCCLSTLEKAKAVSLELKKQMPIIVVDMKDEDVCSAQGITSLNYLLDQNFDEVPAAKIVDNNERTLICWSSGTTGKPKGIQHGSKLWLSILTEKQDGSRIMLTTCMFHMGGFYQPISSLIRGGSMVFVAGEDLNQDISLVYKVAEKYSPTSLVCGSHHAIMLASTALPEDTGPLTSLGMIWPLGTNVYAGILEDLKIKFPNLIGVGNVLAQSEVFTAVAVSFNQNNLGGLYSGMDALKFVDPETGTTVGPNEIGEFAVKEASKRVMIGYLNHKEENDHFFGEDGFLYLGDFGHFDENGVIFYDGRAKDLIKYKNNHLYPKEIEDLLMKHPEVEDAAVFGKPEPSVQELVTAMVVKTEGSAVSADELLRSVDEDLDDYKKLRGGVYFVNKIPRNPQGKILRKNLLSMIS